jgi:hypothetical protein
MGDWLRTWLFGPQDACDHCWHIEHRRDCRAPRGEYNSARRCCKCGYELTPA